MLETKITSFDGAMTATEKVPEKRTYTVAEIQDMLGVSRPTAYDLVKQNLFHCIRVGGHIRVSKKSFDQWLDNQM
ncbi:MAG: helix-turn-helix domain-containing protein [Faecalibacterium sp.]